MFVYVNVRQNDIVNVSWISVHNKEES